MDGNLAVPAEADVDSKTAVDTITESNLDEIFNKDPQFLTKADMGVLVAELRSGRLAWQGAGKKRAVTSSATKGAGKMDEEEVKKLMDSLSLAF